LHGLGLLHQAGQLAFHHRVDSLIRWGALIAP